MRFTKCVETTAEHGGATTSMSIKDLIGLGHFTPLKAWPFLPG